MYRTASPIFDVPEFPTLRRVKPLPKRRRTTLSLSVSANPGASTHLPPTTASVLSPQTQARHPNTHSQGPSQSQNQNHSKSMLNAAGTLISSALDALQSHAGLGLGLPLINTNADTAAAVTQAGTGTTVRSDDVGGGSGDVSLRQQQKHGQQLLMGPNAIPVPGTSPLPFHPSTNNEGEPRSHHSHPRSAYSDLHTPEPDHGHEGDCEDSDGEEEVDSEGTEGDLQERLFLRAETDRLLAHADSLSARMVLQSYYRSMDFGIPEFDPGINIPSAPALGTGMDRATGEHGSVANTTVNSGGGGGGIQNSSSANHGSGQGYTAVGVGGGRGDVIDGDGVGVGDYADYSHHHAQGNTKKRKVPANVGGSPPLHHHHHHLHHHYSPHRGALGLSYGDEDDLEGEQIGFGLNLDVGVAPEKTGFGVAVGGGASDVFGPLPGSTEFFPQDQHYQLSSASMSQYRFPRKTKLSAATLAGLHRKELIRRRKKQLEAVMGTVSVGDACALDHALSANFPPIISPPPSAASSASTVSTTPTSTDSDRGLGLTVSPRVGTGAKAVNKSTGNEDSPRSWELGWGWDQGGAREVKVRLSKRKKLRVVRTMRMTLGRLKRHPDAAPFPTREFAFSCPSVTADRLVGIQEEVANLRSLFGAEIARQSAKAAKINAGSSSASKRGGVGKGGKKRAQQRARTIMSARSGEQPAEFLEMPPKGQIEASGQQQHQPSQQVNQHQGAQGQGPGQVPTPKKGKKKKRSALANASNPHHFKNYVPSRLPHSAGGGHAQAGQNANTNAIWPLPLRFLSADLPPKRRRNAQRGGQTNVHVQSLPQLVIPQEEWMCAFCEYSLFYGDEAEYRRVVRNRKKILKRRRRARERAAAAASGVNAVMKDAAPATEKTRVEDDVAYDGPVHEPAQASSHVRADGSGRAVRPREPPG